MNAIQRTLLATAAAISLVGSVHAATLYSAGATAEMQSPDSVPATFSAGAGAGTVDLQLQGYASLDGDNYYIDIFHVAVNGSDVFSGTWNLGGGGADRVLSGPAGATVSHTGQTVDLSIPVNFLAGSNTVTLSYESPTSFEGSNRAGFQGTGDEGWGVNSFTVSGKVAAAVPEPETYALMLAGLGALGFIGRRKAAAR